MNTLPRKEIILIGGQPATPTLWRAWDEAIGLGPKAQARKRAMRKHVEELAAQLKQQREDRELIRD